jgi:hypothetical protein
VYGLTFRSHSRKAEKSTHDYLVHGGIRAAQGKFVFEVERLARAAFEKSSHTSLNSTTVYRQEAAGRLAEMRQLLGLFSHSNRGRIRKVIPCHPKINRQANPPVNIQQRIRRRGPNTRLSLRGQWEIIQRPPVQGRQRFNPVPLKIVLAVSIRPRLRMPTPLRALHAKSEHGDHSTRRIRARRCYRIPLVEAIRRAYAKDFGSESVGRKA